MPPNGKSHQERGSAQQDACSPTSSPSSKVTVLFALMSVVVCSTAAFGVGCWSRMHVLEEQSKVLVELQKQLAQHEQSLPALPSKGAKKRKEDSLPQPKTKGNKEVPHATYTSKVLDTAASASARSMLLEVDRSSAKEDVESLNRADFSECYKNEDDADEEKDVANYCKVSNKTAARYDEDDKEAEAVAEEDEEEHLPAGQHLLVDIKNVDSEFLNDEHRLAQAMIDVVWESDLTLLSYHCHTLFPMGVTCVGVLLESHISFHTWPEEGVITLDLFTCGSGLLLPVVPLIERLFALPQEMEEDEEDLADAPVMVWSHKYRGFHDNWDRNPDEVPVLSERKDLGFHMSIMDMDMKKKITSVESPFQQIDIYDLIDPKTRDLHSYRLAEAGAKDTYEGQHPEYFQPNRVVYLDGIMQSTMYGDAPYHEGLVHPGTFAHPNPKRAAIIGGGEGATLREFLRHDTIEHVKMIDIDELMMTTSAEFLPTWNNCSDIVGSTPSCFDDPRADVRAEDALAWFIEHFGNAQKDPTTGEFTPEREKEKFDVVVMDALDPQDNVVFAKFLYSNDDFTEALYNSLTEDGVLIMQLGSVPFQRNVPDEFGKSHMRASLEHDLIRFGFKSLHQYEEAACGFESPWSYLVAFKSFSSRKYWYDSEDEVELKIRKRLRPTVSGKPPLKSFDGSTMKKYQVPHGAFETIYCRALEVPSECKYLRGYESWRANAPASLFEVKRSPLAGANNLGVGVFAKEAVSKGSMIMQEKSSNSVHFSPAAWAKLQETLNLSGDKGLEALVRFIETFGFENGLLGKISYDVSSSPLAFVNHGCKGTWNVSPDEDWVLTEENVSPSNITNDARSTKYAKGPEASLRQPFNPVIARHMPHLIGGYDFATRDIAAGEELLVNFLTSVGSAETWAEVVAELQELCKDA